MTLFMNNADIARSKTYLHRLIMINCAAKKKVLMVCTRQLLGTFDSVLNHITQQGNNLRYTFVL